MKAKFVTSTAAAGVLIIALPTAASALPDEAPSVRALPGGVTYWQDPADAAGNGLVVIRKSKKVVRYADFWSSCFKGKRISMGKYRGPARTQNVSSRGTQTMKFVSTGSGKLRVVSRVNGMSFKSNLVKITRAQADALYGGSGGAKKLLADCG